MMRLWVESYARRTPIAPVATLSAAAHAMIIAAWVVATLPASNVPPDSIANRVYYIPPPDKLPGSSGTHEIVHFVSIDLGGVADGAGPRMMGNERPITVDENPGRVTRDTVLDSIPKPAGDGLQDSVFSVLDVDTAVVRSSNSAAPAYPLSLLQAHIMGSVSAQYVVDTTGFADTASFTVIKATHPDFVKAVREALPYMRFQPAKIGTMKVRQLVEQQFSFRIADEDTARKPAKKP